MTSPKPSAVGSGGGEFFGERPPLLEPGRYNLKFEYWETARLFARQPKVTFWFSIADFGPSFGIKVARYYNVKDLKDKPGKFGRFVLTWGCDLVREYAALVPLPVRIDRMNPDCLAALLITAEIETVTKDRRQRDLPPSLHYSVVRRLLHVDAGHAVDLAPKPAPKPIPVPTRSSPRRLVAKAFGGSRHG
jgi:hypothetical protein